MQRIGEKSKPARAHLLWAGKTGACGTRFLHPTAQPRLRPPKLPRQAPDVQMHVAAERAFQLRFIMSRKRDPVVVAAKARSEIRLAFKQLAIFKRPRPVALLHFATALDANAILALRSPYENAPSSNMAHRRAVEASAFAIPSIYRSCPPAETGAVNFDKQIYLEAKQLLDFSYRYEQIDFSYKLADKGQLQIFVAKLQPRITFAYTDKSADEAETALRGRELQIVFTGERLDLDLNAQLQLFSALREAIRPSVKRHGLGCSYTYGAIVIEVMRKLRKEMVKSFPAEMDAAATVGPVAFSELRAFWGALLVISNVHFMAHHLASGDVLSNWPAETTLFRMPRGPLIESISQISELPHKCVETIVGWCTYDPAISNRCPILQPFLPLDGDIVCLPFLFVNGNNMERNFFKLMHRHPVMRPFAQSVTDMKEPVALRELESLFPEPQYRTCKRVQVPGITDADLLVCDTASRMLLVIQHKWLAAPETAEESWGNDAKLMEGVKQAVEAREALLAQPELVRRALGFSNLKPINGIEAVVVCRGFEHTGFVGPTAVPVISEVSFRGLFGKAGNLAKLWDLLNSRPDLKRAAHEVEEFSWELELAGYKFVMPGLKY